MDKTLEAVHVALREIKGMRDQMATWQNGERRKEVQDFQYPPMWEGYPTDPVGRGPPRGGCDGSDRSSGRRLHWENTRRAIPERPGSGRSIRRDYEEDFSHESTGVGRRAGKTGRGCPRFHESPDDLERERTRHRGGIWNRSSSSDSDSSQRRGRWFGTPRSICQTWSSILEGSQGGISMPSFVAIGR